MFFIIKPHPENATNLPICHTQSIANFQQQLADAYPNFFTVFFGQDSRLTVDFVYVMDLRRVVLNVDFKKELIDFLLSKLKK